MLCPTSASLPLIYSFLIFWRPGRSCDCRDGSAAPAWLLQPDTHTQFNIYTHPSGSLCRPIAMPVSDCQTSGVSLVSSLPHSWFPHLLSYMDSPRTDVPQGKAHKHTLVSPVTGTQTCRPSAPWLDSSCCTHTHTHMHAKHGPSLRKAVRNAI